MTAFGFMTSIAKKFTPPPSFKTLLCLIFAELLREFKATTTGEREKKSNSYSPEKKFIGKISRERKTKYCIV